MKFVFMFSESLNFEGKFRIELNRTSLCNCLSIVTNQQLYNLDIIIIICLCIDLRSRSRGVDHEE